MTTKSILSAITKRAKEIRKATGSSWQAALKKAGAELRSTAKKVVRKVKPKKKVTAKKKSPAKRKTTKRKTTKRKSSKKK